MPIQCHESPSASPVHAAKLAIGPSVGLAPGSSFAGRDAIIQSIPGFGPVNTACLFADIPERGTLGRRKAASLFRLAAFDRDSGQPRDSRAQARQLRYMAALAAIRI